jgi:hypothetical protein
MPKANRSTVKQSKFLNVLHIYGLFGIAIAYPIYSFLQVNPAYLLANGVDSEQLYFIITVLGLMIPATLVIVELELSRWVKKLYPAVHLILIALFVALSFFPLLSRIDSIPLWLEVIAVGVLTFLVIREYRTSTFTYVALAILAPITLALTANFVFDHNISQLRNPDRSEPVDWQAKSNNNLAPVVMVVFDALPLIHLLDADGDIDEKRFPNFAQMANESTWYPNATSVQDMTMKSIPSILRGNYSPMGAVLPLPENYPGTLFDLLRWKYRIHVFESTTRLAGTSRADSKARSIDNKFLAGDLAIFYTRSMLPVPVADDLLPLEKDVWGGFFARMPQVKKENWKDQRKWQWEEQQGIGLDDRYSLSKQFVDNLSDYPSNTFHFFHVLMPHHPYQYLPTGREYNHSIPEGTSENDTRNINREAHILQLGLADTMLGRFSDELKRLRQWDDAMVVVVADHGESYVPVLQRRVASQKNFGQIGFIPLIIKYPGQTTGAIDMSNVQTIDIASTVIDTLDIDIDTIMKGRSLIDPLGEIPKTKTINTDFKSFTFIEDDYMRLRGAAHQDAIDFFSLEDPRSDLFNFGPGLQYLGMDSATLESEKLPCEIQSNLPGGTEKHTFASGELIILLQGNIGCPDVHEDAVLAIAINGKIRSVTTSFVVGDKQFFHKTLSDTYYGDGANTVDILLLPR